MYTCTLSLYIYVYDVVEINFDQLGCNWCSSEVPMMSCPKMGENRGIEWANASFIVV